MASTAMKSMPAVFIGHGNPMNNIRRNRWTEGWIALRTAPPRPKAILAVSAHWYIPATMVTAMANVRRVLQSGKDALLIDYQAIRPEAQLAVPIPDHYSPCFMCLDRAEKGRA